MFIVVTGNPVDGYEHFGPFEVAEEANDWAVGQKFDEHWWTIELHRPE